MRKNHLLSRLLAMLTAFALLLSMTGTVVFAATGTWDQNFLITNAVAAQGAPVSAIGGSIEYVMLKGDFFGGSLSQYSTFVTTSPMVMGDDTESTRFWPWQVKVTAGTDFVLKITAKQDLYMKLWQNADTTTTWVNNMQICYVVENAAGTQVTLKTLTVTANETISAADYDAELHMAAGDTAYVVYHMTSGSGTYSSNMRLTVDTDAYDSSLRTDFTESITLKDLISNAYYTDGTVYSALSSGINYEILSGDFFNGGTLTAMTKSSADILKGSTSNDFVRYVNGNIGGHCGVDTVIKITAKKNMLLSLGINPDGNFAATTGSSWATSSAFYYIAENANGDRVTLKQIPITAAGMDHSLFAQQVHLQAGEKLYIVYRYIGKNSGGYGNANMDLKVSANYDSYSADQAVQYAISGTVGFQELVRSAYHTASGTAYAADNSLSYQMLSGDFFGGGTLTPLAKTSASVMGVTDNKVYIQNNTGQFGAVSGTDALIKFQAQKDMQLTITHDSSKDSVGSNGAAGKSSFYYIAENAAGKQVILKEIPITTLGMDASLFTQTVHLKAGDTLYIVYHATVEDATALVCRYWPSLSVDTAAYSANARPQYTTLGSANLTELTKTAFTNTTDATVYSAVNGSLQYELLSGDFVGGGTLTAMEKSAYSYMMGSENPNAFIRNYDGQFGAHNGVDAVLKVTAQENMLLSVGVAEDTARSTGSSWAHNASFLYVLENAAGDRAILKSVPVTQADMASELFDQSMHLRKGETFYIVYTYTGTAAVGNTVANLDVQLDVDAGAFDEDQCTQYPVSSFLDQNTLVIKQIASEGAPVTALSDSIAYVMLKGDFMGGGALSPYTVFTENTVGDSSEMVAIRPWQILSTKGNDFVLQITANRNMALSFSQFSDTADNWATGSAIYYVVENAEGVRVTVKKLQITSGTMYQELYYEQLHLAQGDKAYFIYHYTGTNENTCVVTPSNMRVTVDTAAYDAGKRVDYTQTAIDPDSCTHDYVSTTLSPAGTYTTGLAMLDCALCGNTCTGTLPATKTLKVLTIGNSCTDNTSYYLWQLLDDLKANGGIENVIVANAQIGGTSLDDHWNYISSGSSSYTYRKTTDGTWVYSSGTVSALKALTDEDWDIITINSRIGYSGMSDKFSNLDNILNWLNENKTNSSAKIMYLMPWTCPADSTYADFPSYNNDQLAMYAAITDVTENVVAVNTGIAKILPVGTAIQNGRTSYIGDEFDSDGIHLNTLGMYVAAMTVAGTILETDLTQVTWAPEGIGEDDMAMAIEAASNAVAAPYEITDSKYDPAGFVKTWSLGLQDDISVKFDMRIFTETASVSVTVNGKQTVHEAVTDGQQICVDLAAAQMNDTITIQVTDGNGNESQQFTYTVRQYCEELLAGEHDDATKTLVKAMLNYGGKAQTYFDYNGDNLASAGITVQELAVPAEQPAVSVTGAASGVSFYGATLVFQSRTAVRLYFKVSDGAAHTFTNADGSKTYTPVVNGSLCYIEIGGISPADLDESFTVAVDGALSVTYGAMDYITRMYNKASASQALKAVVSALYTYWSAAQAYIAA